MENPPTPNPNPSVQEVIERRLASFEYLQRVHGGTICWLNSVHLSRRDFENLTLDTPHSNGTNGKSGASSPTASHAPLNSLHYFYLGGAVHSILDQNMTNLADYVKALSGLMKEYETLIGASEGPSKNKIAGVGRRLFRGRLKSTDGSTGVPVSSSAQISPTESLRSRPKSTTSLHKITTLSSSSSPGSTSGLSTSFLQSKYPDFVYLKLYHLPFVPDVYETFLSLCETLTAAYRKLWRMVGSGLIPPDCQELILKLDDKIRRHIVTPTIRDVDALSRNLIYEETTQLDSLLIQAK